jgi:anti-anti-sigma regulatory factor
VFTALFDLTGARTLVGTARLLTEVGVRLRLTGAQPLVARASCRWRTREPRR